MAITGMVLVMFAACNPEENLPGGADNMVLKTLPVGMDSTILNFPYDSLSLEEMEGLAFMREEELLARDVYTFLAGLYTVPIFSQIASSEDFHSEMVLSLLNKYALPDPAATHVAGVFSNADLQSLYNTLVGIGDDSLFSGLMVGALIEETDIADLDAHLSTVVGNEDILFVYGKLRQGSIHHIKAFTKLLKIQFGYIYTPQVLSQADYTAIVGNTIPGGGVGTQGHPNVPGWNCDSTGTGFPHGNFGQGNHPPFDSLAFGHHPGNHGNTHPNCDSTGTGPFGGGNPPVCDSTQTGQGHPHGQGHGFGH